MASVAEAMRKLACSGAELLAITDGLNMGSPSDPIEYAKLAAVIDGLGEALRTTGIPVTGGNVSLYNESPKGAIPPTPLLGGLGIFQDIPHVPTNQLGKGERVFLVGNPTDKPGGSAFGNLVTHSALGDAPHVDLAAEQKLCGWLVQHIQAGRIAASAPVDRGGALLALAKLAIRGGVGLTCSLPEGISRPDWFLLGEPAACVWITCTQANADVLDDDARKLGLSLWDCGTAEGSALTVESHLDVPVDVLRKTFEGATRAGA